MKPLEPIEHTADDAIIWANLNWRGGPRGGPLRWTFSLMQDRRDADLMLRLTQTGALSPPNGRAVCHSLLSFGFEPSEWP